MSRASDVPQYKVLQERVNYRELQVGHAVVEMQRMQQTARRHQTGPDATRRPAWRCSSQVCHCYICNPLCEIPTRSSGGAAHCKSASSLTLLDKATFMLPALLVVHRNERRRQDVRHGLAPGTRALPLCVAPEAASGALNVRDPESESGRGCQ